MSALTEIPQAATSPALRAAPAPVACPRRRNRVVDCRRGRKAPRSRRRWRRTGLPGRSHSGRIWANWPSRGESHRGELVHDPLLRFANLGLEESTSRNRVSNFHSGAPSSIEFLTEVFIWPLSSRRKQRWTSPATPDPSVANIATERRAVGRFSFPSRLPCANTCPADMKTAAGTGFDPHALTKRASGRSRSAVPTPEWHLPRRAAYDLGRKRRSRRRS